MRIYRILALLLSALSLLLAPSTSMADEKKNLINRDNPNVSVMRIKDYVCILCSDVADKLKKNRSKYYFNVSNANNLEVRTKANRQKVALSSLGKGINSQLLVGYASQFSISSRLDETNHGTVVWNGHHYDKAKLNKHIKRATYYGVDINSRAIVAVINSYSGTIPQFVPYSLNSPQADEMLGTSFQSGAIVHLHYSNGALTPVSAAVASLPAAARGNPTIEELGVPEDTLDFISYTQTGFNLPANPAYPCYYPC